MYVNRNVNAKVKDFRIKSFLGWVSLNFMASPLASARKGQEMKR
jgi:hypothetical protein